eukprot:3554004-Alexandrium_andersonii.AAC.1
MISSNPSIVTDFWKSATIPASKPRKTPIEGYASPEMVQDGVQGENRVTGMVFCASFKSGVSGVSKLCINPTFDDHEMARFPRTRRHAKCQVENSRIEEVGKRGD